jgi:hypothetical protein
LTSPRSRARPPRSRRTCSSSAPPPKGHSPLTFVLAAGHTASSG